MTKKPQEETGMRRRVGVPSLSSRLEAVRYLTDLNSSRTRRKYTTNIQHVADALIAAGYTSLDKQAKALGIHRATAWTIIKDKHKLDRLNTKTTKRMLANPELPQCIRDVLERYVAERPEPRQHSKRRIAQAADTAKGK
jgi:hypothetical protein